MSVHEPIAAPTPPNSTSAARELIHITVPLVVLLVAGAGAYYLANLKRDPERVHHPATIPLVETAVVTSNDVGLDIDVDGVVVPYREVRLAAQVSGRIATKAEACRAGNYVTRGTLLMTIDPRDFDLEIARLQQDWAQADNAIHEQDQSIANTTRLVELARQELELQTLEMERIRKLFDDKFVADSEHDAARRQLVVAETAVVRLENELLLQQTARRRLASAADRAKIQLEQARLNRSYTEIHSPVDGVIIRDEVEQDSYVTVSAPLVTIEDTSKVEVRCQLRVEELYWLWRQRPENHGAGQDIRLDYQIPSAPVTVVYELGGRQYTWQGVLARFDGIGLDEATRTVPCRIVVNDPRSVGVRLGDAVATHRIVGPPALVRGMYVTVRVHSTPDATLVRVPETAVQPNNTVFRVEDGKVSIRPVRVVNILESTAMIQADDGSLRPGDRVIISPLPFARDGMEVQQRETTSADVARDAEDARATAWR